LYLEGQSNPKSVVVSPKDKTDPVCEPKRVADRVTCEKLIVFCRAKSDKVVLRIVAGGEILM